MAETAEETEKTAVFTPEDVARDVLKFLRPELLGISLEDVIAGRSELVGELSGCTIRSTLPHIAESEASARAYKATVRKIVDGTDFEPFHQALLVEIKAMMDQTISAEEMINLRAMMEVQLTYGMDPDAIENFAATVKPPGGLIVVRTTLGSTQPRPFA